MLKLTTVLFVLVALFVVPASIFSSSNNGSSPPPQGTTWGLPESNKRCKGETKTEVDPVCLETKIAQCHKTTMVFKLTGLTHFFLKSL